MALKEVPPTAGFRLSLKVLSGMFDPSNYGEALDGKFRQYLDVPYARVVNSGTAALYYILEGLKKATNKRTIIIPSYTCPLIPAAINRAGFRIGICDIEAGSFNYDRAKLEDLCLHDTDIAAIVAVHMAGIPVDIDSLKAFVRGNNIFIIEDCAQSLGALYKGRKVGALADLSFFSLCRGKGLTVYEGGVVVLNNTCLKDAIDSTIGSLERRKPISEAIKVIELFGYWIFYRPALFWFVDRLPELFWKLLGKEDRANNEYSGMHVPLHKVSGIRKAICAAAFPSLGGEIIGQRLKASHYLKRLEGLRGISVFKEADASEATYPYVMVVFDKRWARDKALATLRSLGLGVSSHYSRPVHAYDYLKHIIISGHFPCGQRLAGNGMTLSTNNYLKDDDLDYVLDMLERLLNTSS